MQSSIKKYKAIEKSFHKDFINLLLSDGNKPSEIKEKYEMDGATYNR